MAKNSIKTEPFVKNVQPEQTTAIIIEMQRIPANGKKETKEQEKNTAQPAMPREPQGYLKMRSYDFF